MSEMPLFFKLRFAFVAVLIISILVGYGVVIFSVASDPAILGRIAAQILSGFNEAQP